MTLKYFSYFLRIGDNLHENVKTCSWKKKKINKIFQYVVCWNFYPECKALRINTPCMLLLIPHYLFLFSLFYTTEVIKVIWNQPNFRCVFSFLQLFLIAPDRRDWSQWLSWMLSWLVIRRPLVQSPLGLAAFFHGDWSWNIFYCDSLPSADSRSAVVSFWWKQEHKYWLTT